MKQQEGIWPLFHKGYCITSTDTQVTKNILHVQDLQGLNLHVYYP